MLSVAHVKCGTCILRILTVFPISIDIMVFVLFSLLTDFFTLAYNDSSNSRMMKYMFSAVYFLKT